MKLLPLFTLFGSLLFPANADHLLLTRVVTQPDAAESFSIYNPTNSPINLSDYYICDDENYYKMQTEGDMNPASHPVLGYPTYGFSAQFPDRSIGPGDTLIIVLHENYNVFYQNKILPDLVMFGDSDSSLLPTASNSFGSKSNKIENNAEMLILFSWDGTPESLIQDVDYFLWGNSQSAVDKPAESGYREDTHAEDQLFFMAEAEPYYSYSRIGVDERDELETGGNGISSHDETSENFRQSWEIITLFNMGCTDEVASNYDPEAEYDDGSCEYPENEEGVSIDEIIHNCGDAMGESLECNGKYDLSSASAVECSLYEESLTTSGVIIDYFDITVYDGPHSFTIESQDGYRIDFVVWPESSSYQDGFDITTTDLNILTGNFGTYKVQITGELGAYCDDDELLDINSEWQVTVEYESDIVILDDGEGEYGSGYIENVTITPAPFAILPSLGETLDFSYSFPNKSRVIIRIHDLSGRFITSLVDKYYSNAGTVIQEEGSSAWDGRDQLGQIVAPGTYIMHIEAMNPVTGETHTDAAPIVVGVKN